MGDLVLRAKKTVLLILLLLVTVALVTAGYSFWKSKDTKTPDALNMPQVGIIDMSRAIKAHPRYAELGSLGQQYNALAAKAGMQQKTEVPVQESQTVPDTPNPSAGINAALEQEYNAKMANKKAELTAALNAKAEKLHSNLAAELKAYTDELDKTYQPQIFSIQLKIKTVQVSKEEMAVLQGQLDKLSNERAAKIAAKEKELARQMDEQMAPEQAAIEQQLSAYSAQLNADLSQKAAMQSADIASRNQPPAPAPVPAKPQSTGVSRSELDQQLAMKQREIDALQQFIIDDIRDKAAKVAVERKLETVLAKVQVNVSAVDITGEVISQFTTNGARLQ